MSDSYNDLHARIERLGKELELKLIEDKILEKLEPNSFLPIQRESGIEMRSVIGGPRISLARSFLSTMD